MMSDLMDHDLQQMLERFVTSATLVPPKIYENGTRPTLLNMVTPGHP
jgi:hypothetical protein